MLSKLKKYYRKHFPRKYHWYAVRICIKDAKTHQRMLDWQTTVGFTIQNRVLFDENILNTASKPDLPKHVQVKVDAGETIHFTEINTYLGYMPENTQERNE